MAAPRRRRPSPRGARLITRTPLHSTPRPASLPDRLLPPSGNARPNPKREGREIGADAGGGGGHGALAAAKRSTSAHLHRAATILSRIRTAFDQ